ncbi:MAG: TonB-dependent receptor [Candidatus Omnitrophota bacterium]
MRSDHIFLALIVLLFLSSNNSFADGSGDETTLQEFSLGRIIVSATRSEIEAFKLAEDVTVYDARQIQKLPARNAADALFYFPGVDIEARDRLGQTSDVNIRGSKSRHVLVMVDDIPFNTQLSGQANLSKIPIENVQRIEVIKGASSSAWGSSLGGVINVITEDPGKSEKIHGELENSVAKFGTFKNSLKIKGRAGEAGYLMMVSRFSSEGFHPDANVQEEKIYSKVKHPLGDQADLTTSFGYSAADVSSGVLSNNRLYDTPYRARYGKVGLDINKPGHNIGLAYKFNDQDTTSDTYNGTTRQIVTASTNSNLYQGISLNDRVSFEDDILTFGGDLERHKFKSSNYLDMAESIDMQAFYANYLFNVNQWHITPGVRYDHNNRFGDQASPSLGVVYEFGDPYQTKVRAKAARAFNAPPLMWIYNEDPAFLVAPNPDLEAERGMSYEAGVNSTINKLGLDLSVYRVDVKSALQTVFDSDIGRFIVRNLEQVRRMGVETKMIYELNSRWSFYASAAYNHTIDKNTGEELHGSGMAKQNLRFGCLYEYQEWQIHLLSYYNRWNMSYSDRPNDKKPLFDLHIAREIYNEKDIISSFFVNIYNLADSAYWHNVIYPYPGRYFEAGLQVRF